MPKNTTVHLERILHAVWVLLQNCNLSIPEATKVADFSKKDVTNESIHKAIRQRKTTALAVEGLHPPPRECAVNGIRALLLEISNLTDTQTKHTSTTTTTSTMSTDNAIPPPKRKQIQLPLHSVQQKCTNDLKSKRHKADVQKAFVELYVMERQKPDGMLARQVAKKIEKKYGSVTPHYSTMVRYANEGLVNASPKKMGPVGNISATAYKLLCHACQSFVPINQLNSCTYDNELPKLIPTFMKTFDISSPQAILLLNRVTCDTVSNINANKLNCSKDSRIWCTTYQNLDLWFDSWETFFIHYGFAMKVDGTLVFERDFCEEYLTWTRLASCLTGATALGEDA
jgi:hypothetical protein